MRQNANIAVCSVFAGDSNTAFWLNLQLEALSKTLPEFDHLVYLNQADESLFNRFASGYRGRKLIGQLREISPL